ncbi:MAG: aminopeptidase [Candidatus Omnitrophota bacterium]
MIEKVALNAIFFGAVKLKTNESCLIVTDKIKEPIARAFYEYAGAITSNVKICVMQPTKEHGSEPPPEVEKEMLDYDVQFLITDKSLSHTKSRRDASNKGARIASMPDITEDIINRCCAIDYRLLKNESQKLHAVLSNAKQIKVKTELGTDIVFDVGKSKWFGENGGSFDYPGAFGNLPEGEVSFAPENAQGTYVVDASFPGLGILDFPLYFEVAAGIVKNIRGKYAQTIKDRLDQAGFRAYCVAELGIGLNPKAKIIGIVLEDEKVKGTVHIAVGNNLSYGGNNDVPLHLDGVITKPDVYADDKKIMESGKFL